MITLDAVTRRYGEFTAVDHVSFTARPGRVTGFLGPNGAGKSTTMRIIVGLTHATIGSATVAGRCYVDLPNPGLGADGQVWRLGRHCWGGAAARGGERDAGPGLVAAGYARAPA
jgi:ABC-type branched-subunit amino acid transport system ATPase component